MKMLSFTLFGAFLGIALLLAAGISRSRVDLTLDGEVVAGEFSTLDEGLIYFPSGWDSNKKDSYSVMVILPGYNTYMRSMAAVPEWKEGADRFGVVLFFVDRDHMGWYEDRASEDSRRIRRILREFRHASWVKDKGISLFGFSAGAIMSTSFLCQKDMLLGPPLFDKLFAASGGFGIEMDAQLKLDPQLENIVPVPTYLFWGEDEAPFVGTTVQDTLTRCGWDVEGFEHDGGHWLASEHIIVALGKAS